MTADLARALHRVTRACQVVVTEPPLQTGLDAVQRAEGRVRRRIAAAAADLVYAYDAVGLLADDLHVVDVRAEVLGDDEPPAQCSDVPSQHAQQRFALAGLGIADQHGFAATQVQTGDRGLVGHAARQPQRIAQRLILRRIGPHAQAAEGGAEDRVVDRDDAAQAERLVVPPDNLLVGGLAQQLEHAHRCSVASAGERL